MKEFEYFLVLQVVRQEKSANLAEYRRYRLFFFGISIAWSTLSFTGIIGSLTDFQYVIGALLPWIVIVSLFFRTCFEERKFRKRIESLRQSKGKLLSGEITLESLDTMKDLF